MSALIETSIWLAIRSRIESIPLSYPFAWPSEYFQPPANGNALQPYIRVGRISIAPVSLMIDYGKKHQREGAVMLTLVYPIRSKTAVSFYDQIAATIANHFKDGTNMSFNGVCVTVTTYPHINEGYEENGYWTVPIRVSWRCFA